MSGLLDAVSKAVVGVLGVAPDSVQNLIGGRRVNSDGDVMEPEVAAALRLLNAMPGGDFSESGDHLPGRATIDEEAALFGGAPIAMDRVQSLSIPAPHGSIPARRYVAREGADEKRLLLYFHGGGWVLGSLDSHDATCRFLAAHAGVSVLSVGYRLAPEDPFPAAPDDALTAFDYAVSMATDWGHDPALIGVAGDSAGGNLAAVLAQDRRDAEHPPALQVLFVPATNLRDEAHSYEEFESGYFLTKQQMDWYKVRYLQGQDASDPRISPALADDLSGLAPAYVATAGFDPLRDEGEAYARALAEAGVPVTLRRHRGLIHGFVNSVGVGTSPRDAMLEACGAIRLGLRVGV